MNPCPSFTEALAQERFAAREQHRQAPSTERRVEAIARLADLDEIEMRARATLDLADR